jgi:hypothetical protein
MDDSGMTRLRATTMLLALAATTLVGCKEMAYILYLFSPHEQDVKAECGDLSGKTVAVAIYCDRRVEFDYPSVRMSLSSRIGENLQKNVKKVRVVDARRVVKYQDGNIYWEEMDKTELAKAFEADYVLYVSILEFSTREPGSVGEYSKSGGRGDAAQVVVGVGVARGGPGGLSS